MDTGIALFPGCQEEGGKGCRPPQAPKLGLCKDLHYLRAKPAHPWTLDKEVEAKAGSRPSSLNKHMPEGGSAFLNSIYSVFKRHLA